MLFGFIRNKGWRETANAIVIAVVVGLAIYGVAELCRWAAIKYS